MFWLLSRYHFAKRELEMHDYDIVHLNSSVLADWLAPAKKKAKTIIHIREPFRKGKFDILNPFFKHQIQKYADKIIAISKNNAARLELLEKTEVVYNFNNSVDGDKADCKSKDGQVLYVGGSKIIKGFLTVVDSLDYLDPDIKIVFGGEYYSLDKKSGLLNFMKDKITSILPLHKKIQAAVIKIKNHPNASFVGLFENINEMLQESEFLISPFSKPHFSRPVIEAFANNKCAIGSNTEGMDEIIDHGVNGLIIKKDNPYELAHAINYLHSSPELRSIMAENGYMKAKKLFSKSNVVMIQRIYENL